MRRLLWRRIRDARLRALTAVFIDAGAPGSPPGRGLPIGNLTSQHFANFYLGPLDRLVTRGLGAGGYVRYMDDVVVLDGSRARLWEIHAAVDAFLRERLALERRPEVTRVAPVAEGVPFLGFVVFPGATRFDPRRARRWRRCMGALARAVARGQLTEEDAQWAADSLKGWAWHGDTGGFCRAWVARRSNAAQARRR